MEQAFSNRATPAQSAPPLTSQQLSYERRLEGLRRDLGPACMRELADPTVVEIMLNADGRIWRDRLGEGMSFTGDSMPVSQAEKLFGSIADLLQTTVGRDNPILEGELPLDGSRFEGIYPPIVSRPIFALRKKASMIFTLEDYEKKGILTHLGDPVNQRKREIVKFTDLVRGMSHGEIIRHSVRMRKNIVVFGGTGSGKTTLVNAILHAIYTLTNQHRIVLIEDTGEVQCAAENYVQMRSNSRIDMTMLLAATLRLRPDRIIVGEVRGRAALALLKMWNTGHPGGLATIHADDCSSGLVRIEDMINENRDIRANPHEIARAIDVCIFIGKDEDIAAGRKVSEIMVVEGYDEAQKRYITTHI